MQIRKTYYNIKPELLYDEVRDMVVKQGTTLGETKFETYSLPTDSSTFISRGTLTFRIGGRECVRAHLVGSAIGELKLVIDINDELFPATNIKALQDDLDFIFSSYEIKPQ